MEGLATDTFDLDLGRRVLIIIIFLVGLWYFLNLFATKVKSGQMKMPGFLTNRFPGLKNLDQAAHSELYDMKIIQRQMMPDGYELMVLDINDRHILLSKHVSSGIQYLAELGGECPVDIRDA